MSNSYKFYSDTKDIMKKYVNATEGAIIYGISKSKIRDLILIPHRYAKHDTYKTVSIQIVRTVLCSMVKQF